MKNWIKKLGIALLGILCMFGITGCSEVGSEIITKLVINEDLSGIRVMDVDVNSAVMSKNFKGDINDLNAIINENCPKELKWTYDGDYHYHVELSFASPADYKRQVEAIIGKEVTLELSAPNTIWANGFRAYESFSSADLLGWLKDILVDNALIQSSYSSYVFKNGDTQVVFKDQSYTSNQKVDINEQQYLPLDQIDILTTIKDLDTFDRSVIFYIPKQSMDQKKTEIEKFLNSNVPSGAHSKWDNYKDGTTMTVTAENMDIKALDHFTAKVLASNQNVIEINEERNENKIFSFAKLFKETLNLSSYGGDESGRVSVGYYLKSENNIKIDNDENAKSHLRTIKDVKYPGYEFYMTDKTSELSLQYQIIKHFMIKNSNLTTQVQGSDEFLRTLKLTFNDVPTEADQADLLARLQNKVNNIAEISTEADETYAITIKQKGTSKDLSESSQAIFGSDLTIARAEETGLLALFHKTAFCEAFSLTDFLQDSISDDYQLTYAAKMGAMETINTNSLTYKGDVPIVSGGTVTIESSKNNIKIAFGGRKINLIGVFIWLVIAVAAVYLSWNLKRTGVFALIKEDASEIFAKHKGNLKEKLEVVNKKTDIIDESVQIAKPQDDSVQLGSIPTYQLLIARYCPECGQEHDEDAVYCENCGEKLIDD